MRTNVFAPTFDLCDSYGRVASELAAGLEQLGWQVNRIGEAAPAQVVTPCFGGFLLGYPTHHERFGALATASAGVRVALTMFEATALPEGWVGALNRCDAVVAPSRFVREVFIREGVSVPVHIVPLSVSAVYTKQPVLRAWDGSSPFRVLVIGDRGARKGWWEALLAFHQAFGDDPRYELILKTRKTALRVSNPNVRIIEGDYSDIEMRALYDSAHLMVFPGREGFGLPPREFAGTGGVAMALDWGGTADGIYQWGAAIPVAGMEPAFRDNAALVGTGEWAVPDVARMAKMMRAIADDYALYAHNAYINAQTFVKNTYIPRYFGLRCASIYKQVMEEHDACIVG